MLQVKKLLILILLLIAVGYGGVKGYIYYKVKTRMDNLAIQVSPWMGIEYKGISSTLGGTVTLENLTLRPKAFDDYIQIDQLTLTTPDLGFLLSQTLLEVGSQSLGHFFN